MNLFVAIPSHSRSIAAETAEALVQAQAMVMRRGGSFRWHWESGANISVVRNILVGRFLQTDADLLLMLDADQAIWSVTLERMVDLGRAVVGCIYPRRELNWSNTRPQSVYEAMSFVGALEADEHGNVNVSDGFARASCVGTGVLLLRREVFTALMQRFPDLQGRGFRRSAYPELDETGRWGFFNMMEDQDGVQISEDLSFCKRWRAAGGEIWADIVSHNIHVGPYRFEGNYMDYLQAISSSSP